MDEFKRFTLGLIDGDHVWWDFDGPSDFPANSFEFGHRIVVGLDPFDGLIFGRISLFATLHFGVQFGRLWDATEPETVILDIDPLAESPPNDVKEQREKSARFKSARLADSTKGLATAIREGQSKRAISELLRKIEAHGLKRTARSIHLKIKDAGKLAPLDRERLFRDVLIEQSQRILNLIRVFVDGIKDREPELSALLCLLLASDASTPNGLTPAATASLELGRSAMQAQMLAEYEQGLLDERRIAELIGKGPGVATVGHAILQPVRLALGVDLPS